MSEIQTSLNFRQFSYVPFPDNSDFGQCLKSEQKRSDLGHFFLSEIRTLKNPNGTKVQISGRKKCLKSNRLCLDFGHFYLHTSYNLLPFICSVKLNVGVSKQNQKSLLQAISKPMAHLQTFGFKTLSEFRTC